MKESPGALNILCFVKERMNPYYSGFLHTSPCCGNLDIVINVETGKTVFIKGLTGESPYDIILIDYELGGLNMARTFRALEPDVAIMFFPSLHFTTEQQMEVTLLGCSILEEKFYNKDFEDSFSSHLSNKKNKGKGGCRHK